MSKRASSASGNGYFAVEFEIVSEGRYAAAIGEFRQHHYNPALFRLLSSPAKPDNGEPTNGHDSATHGHAKKK